MTPRPRVANETSTPLTRTEASIEQNYNGGCCSERAFHLQEFNSVCECSFYLNTDNLIHLPVHAGKKPGDLTV